MILIPIFYFLISLIPGIYSAKNKYFIVAVNSKRNSYFMRALYLIPVLSSFSLLLAVFVWGIGFCLLEDALPDNSYSSLICPIIADMIVIAAVRKYIPKDVPPEFWEDFFNYSYYIFIPETVISSGRAFYTKFILLPKNKYGMCLKQQKEDLILNYDEIISDISITTDGYIIATKYACNILEKYQLTGFNLRNTKPFKEKNSSKSSYFQIECNCILPEMSKKTTIVLKKSPAFDIPDNMVYYPLSLSRNPENLKDFNLTYEIFGEDRQIQDLNNINRQMWVVSKKTMLIFMKYFNQNQRNFIPVHFVEDNIT